MRLDEQGVTNSGIIEDESGLHLNAKDPDNIALEFFYMPGPVENPRVGRKRSRCRNRNDAGGEGQHVRARRGHGS